MKVGGTVSDILGRKQSTVWSVSPTATVFDAIQQMAEKNVGALPVIDGEKLLGMISERDYTRKVILQGKSSKQATVAEIMARDPITTTLNHSIEDCMELMTQHRVRHLPVVEGGRVVGVVSIGDLVKWTISAQSAALAQMESYITGSY